MSQTFEFYTERAEEAEKEAAKAKLDNVRDRAERAARTWRGLASQARQVATNRRREEERRAAKRESEADEAEQALIQLDAAE